MPASLLPNIGPGRVPSTAGFSPSAQCCRCPASRAHAAPGRAFGTATGSCGPAASPVGPGSRWPVPAARLASPGTSRPVPGRPRRSWDLGLSRDVPAGPVTSRSVLGRPGRSHDVPASPGTSSPAPGPRPVMGPRPDPGRPGRFREVLACPGAFRPVPGRPDWCRTAVTGPRRPVRPSSAVCRRAAARLRRGRWPACGAAAGTGAGSSIRPA